MLGRFIVLTILACAADVYAKSIQFELASQPVGQAIQQFARQSGLQVFARSADIDDLVSHPVHGEHEAKEALNLLVSGTPLEVVSIGNGAFLIRRQAAIAAVEEPAETPEDGPANEKPPYQEELESAGLREPGMEEILVTGSRIRRPEFELAQPVLSLGQDELDRWGVGDAGAALSALPGFGVASSNAIGGQSAFGVGQTFSNFLGLGSQRTLTLVNGRRFVSTNTASSSGPAAPGQQVDLNVIPLGLIDSVEVIAIGGAPVYGSDAIAGTVNFKLKEDFEGLSADLQYGITDQGDARQKTVSALFGQCLEDCRGHLTLSAEYHTRGGLLESDRDFLAERPFLAPNPADTGPEDGISAQRVLPDLVVAGITDGGLPLPPLGLPGGWVTDEFPDGAFITDADGVPLQFAPDGSLVPYTLGAYGGNQPVFVSGGDGLHPAEYSSLLAPVTRTLLHGLLTYPLGDSVNLFSELAISHTEGQEIRELMAINSAIVPDQGPIRMSVDNPFLSEQARNIIRSNGFDSFDLSRNLSELLDPYPATTEVDVLRFVGGLEGTGQWLGASWDWDLSLVYGESENNSSQVYINDERFYRAVDAVRDPASGEVVCRNSGSSGCVPLNLFGLAAPSQAAIDYVTEIGQAESRNEQSIVTAAATGSVPLGRSRHMDVSFGLEHREESASFRPDAIMAAGNSRVPGFSSVQGSYHTNEIFTEFSIPLFTAGRPEATPGVILDGAFRYVEHSQAGGDITWSLGARYHPHWDGGESWSFRGVVSEAIRAPASTELFLAPSPSRTTADDPCDMSLFQSGPNPVIREDNCRRALAEFGLAPEDFTSNIPEIGVIGTTSGNPDLENEAARSWSAGMIWEPVRWTGFRVNADWIDITLDQGIQFLSVGEAMAACYDSPQYPAVESCGSFSRSEQNPGQVDDFQTRYFNSSKLEFSGLMLSARMSKALGSRGYDFVAPERSVTVNFDLFFQHDYRVRSFAASPEVDVAGTIQAPGLEAQIRLLYQHGNTEWYWRTLWTSSVNLDNDLTFETSPINRIDDYFWSSLSFAYRFQDRFRGRLVVNNVFDIDPPFEARVSNSSLARRAYDVLGRSYVINLEYQF